MQVVHDAAVAVARTDASVLILGEDGSGKKVLATRIHALSRRAAKPITCLDVAYMERDLVSQIFGHMAPIGGASAESQEKRVSHVDGSTIVLRHVIDVDDDARDWMRALVRTRTVTPHGQTAPTLIDILFIGTGELSSFNPDRKSQRTSGIEEWSREFDVTLTIPPLRERRAEIPELALMFARRQRPDLSSTVIPSAIMKLLQRYSWPSNLLELDHVVQRAVLLSGGNGIGVEHLPEIVVKGSETDDPAQGA